MQPSHIHNKYILPSLAKYKYSEKSSSGYALPLVLFAVSAISILIASSYRISLSRNLVGRNLTNAEIVDDTSESFLEIYKGLLNSNSQQSLNYFWLSQSCSPYLNVSDCPPDYINSTSNSANGIKIPTRTFFQDTGESWESYCHDYTATGKDTTASNCLGRAAAPVCSVHSRDYPAFRIPWLMYKNAIDKFSRKFELYPTLSSYNWKSSPHAYIYKKTQIGSPELGGETWMDIHSFTLNKNSSNLKASKSFRVRYSIDKFIDSSKFAYLSAGSYHTSKSPYSLTNLSIKSDSTTPIRGVILLRQNLADNFRCTPSSIYNLFNIKDNHLLSTIPRKGNGGLGVHAIKFPNVPDSSTNKPIFNDLKRYVVRGTKLFRSNNLSTKSVERIIKFENLFITRDSTLVIETSSKYPVTLLIADSLDVAPGGRICNVEIGKSLSSCGSGNPANLLIKGNPLVWKKENFDSSYRFVDSTIPADASKNRFYKFTDNEAFCSSGAGGFGELITANNNPGIRNPRPKSQKPGPSFTFSSTGGKSDILSAFIVGKYASFNAAGVSNIPPLIQAPFYEVSAGKSEFTSSSFIATHRGRLAAVNINPYTRVNNQFVMACKTSNCIYTLLSPPDNRWSPHRRITLNNMDPHRTSTPFYSVNPDSYPLDSTFILAVASSRNLNTQGYPPNIWVSYNWKTKIFNIRPFTVSTEKYQRNWNIQNESTSYLLLDNSPVPSIVYNGNSLPNSFNALHPDFNRVLLFLEEVYKVKLTQPSVSPYFLNRSANIASLTTSPHRRYKGSVWTKNICFSINRRLNRERVHEFIFPIDFHKDLSDRYTEKYPNHDLDYGMRSYKYTNTSNWDSTKGF